jgi:hypothetical protein
MLPRVESIMLAGTIAFVMMKTLVMATDANARKVMKEIHIIRMDAKVIYSIIF